MVKTTMLSLVGPTDFPLLMVNISIDAFHSIKNISISKTYLAQWPLTEVVVHRVEIKWQST